MPLNKVLKIIIKEYLSTLNDEQRIDFISDCMERYCKYCGSEHLPCYCTRDD
jgi:hypothetical protein